MISVCNRPGWKSKFPARKRLSNRYPRTHPNLICKSISASGASRWEHVFGYHRVMGNQLSMIVKASVRFDLDDEPNVGSGDRYSLDIVTPEELLRLLEQSEVDQRRRLEQVLRELKEVGKFPGAHFSGNETCWC